jgi:hypothetical protein
MSFDLFKDSVQYSGVVRSLPSQVPPTSSLNQPQTPNADDDEGDSEWDELFDQLDQQLEEVDVVPDEMPTPLNPPTPHVPSVQEESKVVDVDGQYPNSQSQMVYDDVLAKQLQLRGIYNPDPMLFRVQRYGRSTKDSGRVCQTLKKSDVIDRICTLDPSRNKTELNKLTKSGLCSMLHNMLTERNLMSY